MLRTASALERKYNYDAHGLTASDPSGRLRSRHLRRPGNFTILLIILLGLIVVPTFFESSETAGVVTTVFLSLMLGAGLRIFWRRRTEFVVACVLTGAALMLRWILLFRHDRWLLLPTAVCWYALMVFTVVVIVRYVLTEARVTYDTISGAICGYLLFGLSNAVLFATLELLHPGSLHAVRGPTVLANGQPDVVKQLIHFIYFSLVTLAGLGYGDITPASSPARAFAALEGIAGQFYIAVLIARLVSIHASSSSLISERQHDSPDSGDSRHSIDRE